MRKAFNELRCPWKVSGSLTFGSRVVGGEGLAEGGIGTWLFVMFCVSKFIMVNICCWKVAGSIGIKGVEWVGPPIS